MLSAELSPFYISPSVCKWWLPLQGLWKLACGQVSYSTCETAANTMDQQPLHSCLLRGFAASAQLAEASWRYCGKKTPNQPRGFRESR